MSPDKKNRNWNERGIMPVVILTIVALVSVLLLALTANLTQEARIKQDELMKSENQRLLFPDADAFELVELSAISADLPDVKKADLAKRGDETLGYVIEVSKGGYGGPLPVLTGVGSDGTIIGIQILDNGETAGIGKKVEDEAYRDQFVGQDFSEPVGVDTIGGATISSASVNASVKDALVAYGVLSGAGELPVKLDPKESIFADGIFTEADAAPYAEQKITAVWDVSDASGNPLGTIFESTVQGYGGDVPVLTGFDPEGSIVGVALGDNSETEGFGKRWEDPAMMEQFVGQSARDDLQIDMIAEVTVTSHAVKGGIDNAKAAFLLMSGEGSSEEPGEDIKNELFPGATFSALDVSQFDGIASAHKSDAGYVVAADAKGFGGDMTILVGYETDGAISGVLLESHNETPGYGMKAEEAEYRDQYIGQKAGDDITVDGITGATVTSEAFVDAVSRTAEVFAVIDTLPEATEDTQTPDKDDPRLALFPDAEFKDVDAADYEDDGVTAIYQTEDGYVIDAAVKGYGGDISFSVGYTNDGEIVGILIGEHSETPGLGARIEDEEYKEQFVGLKADDIDVDGIAGATISSEAMLKGVQATADVFTQLTGEESEEEPEEEPEDDDPKLVLFPDAEFEDVDAADYKDDGVTAIYQTEDGYVIDAAVKGYGGDISFSVGYTNDGEIVGILIGEHSETPGLGARIEDEEYKEQFVGLKADDIDVDGIAGATVSSEAVLKGVQATADVFTQLTGEEPVEESEEEPEDDDPKLVLFPDAEFEDVDAADYEDDGVTAIYQTEDGYVIDAAVKGYGGDISFSVGYTNDGEIVGILIGEHSETPGLGARIEDEEYKEQFVGLKADDIDVDGIAGATVSSEAVLKGVQATADVFTQLTGEEPVEESEEEPEEEPEDDDPKLVLFPDAEFEDVDAADYEDDGVTAIYQTEDGYVIDAAIKGYAGDISFSVGYTNDGEIVGILVGEHSETPGLGARIEDEEYKEQFVGLKADDIDVDGIAGATVSSEAMLKGVQMTADVFTELTGEESAEEPEDEPEADDPKLALFPDAEFEDVDAADYEDDGVTAIYQTEDGYVIDAAVKGYAGNISFSVGYTNDGEIVGLLIGDHSETPGLGSRIEDEEYKEQFVGLKADDIDVDGIAGATISSEAMLKGVQATADVFNQLTGEESADEPEADDPKLALFPDAEFEDVDAADYEDDGVTAIYQTEDGYVIDAAVKGYAGDISFSVGYTNDGEIVGLLIGEHSETPGLGARIEDEAYKEQFVGLKADDIDVDGIAGATISSEAMLKGVQMTADVFTQLTGEESAEEPEDEPEADDPKLALFPDAEFEDVDAADYEDDGVTAIYQTEDGYVIDAAVKGYAGDISFSVGYTNDGEIVGLLIGEHSETPGLGAKIEDEEYKEQFVGLKADDIDVDGIAGATVSSEAMLKGVQMTADVFTELSWERQIVALRHVLEDAVEFAALDVSEEDADAGIKAAFEAENRSGRVIGTIYEVSVGGYAAGNEGKPLVLFVGIDNRGNVLRVTVKSSGETEGIGSNALTEDYLAEFEGWSPNDDIKVDFVSGATITSRAVAEAVDIARNAARGGE